MKDINEELNQIEQTINEIHVEGITHELKVPEPTLIQDLPKDSTQELYEELRKLNIELGIKNKYTYNNQALLNDRLPINPESLFPNLNWRHYLGIDD